MRELMKGLRMRGWAIVAAVLLAGIETPAHDLSYFPANLGKKTAVTNGEVILSPNLLVNPPRKTILPGDTITFTAQGATNPVTWFQLDLPSGSSVSSLSSSSILYTAGTTASVVDVVEAWDGYNSFGRAYINIISPAEVAALGKAVIVAGGRSLDDPVWIATDYLADNAFNVLRYRGFSRENIHYLSFQPGQDADGDGDSTNDIDLASTLVNCGSTFSNWVGNAADLFVYLVDHGSASEAGAAFRLNAAEQLSATNLDAWLDQIQNTYNTDVTLVMDFCYSGAFLPLLTYTGTAKRVVIAATSAGELTYFVAGGAVSFSDAFFSGLLLGLDVEAAFLLAQNAMDNYQHAVLDDNGNGLYSPGVDGSNAAQVAVGASFIAGKDIPVIGGVIGNQLLTDTTTATLWADDIASLYPIDRVWSMIIPPSYQPETTSGIPVVTFPELTLAYSNTIGRYQSAYEGFTEQGAYKSIYYARDAWGSVSLPRDSLVIQESFDERAILVSGGPSNDAAWTSIRNMSEFGYSVLRARVLPSNRIQWLAPVTNLDADADGTNDVDALPTLANFRSAVTNWAAATNAGGPADKLSVILIGATTGGCLRLNSNECLSASDVDGLLDQFQISNRQVNVIMDFDDCGSYLPLLLPPAGRERVTIASTQAGKTSLWNKGGFISFARQFFQNIFSGRSLGDAHAAAAETIRRCSGRLNQRPQLDDTGDGVSQNPADGPLAQTRYIGPTFWTGEDLPSIGSVMPDAVLPSLHGVTLWAKDILDVDGISNVWAVVTPPDFVGTNELPQTDLAWNPATLRYEAWWTNLPTLGEYTITFYAMDKSGEVSPPTQASLTGPDAYEEDDNPVHATPAEIWHVQPHNFHSPDDEDWVYFYGNPGLSFEILAEQVGTNINLQLEVYYQQSDGTFSNLEYLARNDVALGTNVSEETYVDFLNYPEDFLPGYYYVRVFSADTNCWGESSEYELSVYFYSGADAVAVYAVDALNPNGWIAGSSVSLDGGAAQSFVGTNKVQFNSVPAGPHQVQVNVPTGYVAVEDPKYSNQIPNPNNAFYGNPRNKQVTTARYEYMHFVFQPIGWADGSVRDRWTGQPLSGAALSWRARNGTIVNTVYDGYPNAALYETTWQTLADGNFPTNVLLPRVDWDLTVTRSGYAATTFPAVITGLGLNERRNVGVRYLTPLDTNANHIADWWETLYLAGVTNFTSDSDEDGVNDEGEYYAGTLPGNPGDVLESHAATSAVPGSLTLTWPVRIGRTYRVTCAEMLGAGAWALVYGPSVAPTNGHMSWTATGLSESSNRTYRIEVLVPQLP